ncbi:hypothetical protein F4553_000312 [Allocatelliglobosispora scoriae]|uniref:HEAT repeat domain-containing protein n=1 Tax=Allocatelliglobosispora scoriae TaxID=643052 RepID=A0A841BIP9_9ACTN|nr:HEAT repeat domain-containing protein [Allocatelliglobosispora scoriae]MBB5866933.1 hypothetical protein [Allocatelliglobosispora scoriae]
MEITELLDRLGAGAQPVRQAAAAELIDLGEDAVAAVAALMRADVSTVATETAASVLWRIGLPALGPVVEMLDGHPAEMVRWKASLALGSIADKLTDLAPVARLLAHPSPRVRTAAAYTLQGRGERALPHAGELITLLDDPDPQVRERAGWALPHLGPGVVPALQRIRRDGPGRLRARVLTALADTDPDALDLRDKAALRRLIRVKQLTEVPAPMHLCGLWLALPTTDQAAVLAALDLSDPFPVTMRLGESAWNHDNHSGGVLDDHSGHARAYVTPALDGWTLVFGRTPSHDHDPDTWAEQTQRQCAELSGVFGAAHGYIMSCGDGFTSWCIAEHGAVIRFYAVEHDTEIGPPHPAEAGYLLPDQRPALPADAFDGVDLRDQAAVGARWDQLKLDHAIPDTCTATTIARQLSVDPAAMGPHLRVEGGGVIARTACGRDLPTPPGALEI